MGGEATDIRTVTYNELLVLQALGTGSEYGLEIMSLTGLSAGTVYPILRRFEATGFVSSRMEDAAVAHRNGRPARRIHALSGDGRAVLQPAREAFLARHRAMGLVPSPGSGTP